MERGGGASGSSQRPADAKKMSRSPSSVTEEEEDGDEEVQALRAELAAKSREVVELNSSIEEARRLKATAAKAVGDVRAEVEKMRSALESLEAAEGEKAARMQRVLGKTAHLKEQLRRLEPMGGGIAAAGGSGGSPEDTGGGSCGANGGIGAGDRSGGGGGLPPSNSGSINTAVYATAKPTDNAGAAASASNAGSVNVVTTPACSLSATLAASASACSDPTSTLPSAGAVAAPRGMLGGNTTAGATAGPARMPSPAMTSRSTGSLAVPAQLSSIGHCAAALNESVAVVPRLATTSLVQGRYEPAACSLGGTCVVPPPWVASSAASVTAGGAPSVRHSAEAPAALVTDGCPWLSTAVPAGALSPSVRSPRVLSRGTTTPASSQAGSMNLGQPASFAIAMSVGPHAAAAAAAVAASHASPPPVAMQRGRVMNSVHRVQGGCLSPRTRSPAQPPLSPALSPASSPRPPVSKQPLPWLSRPGGTFPAVVAPGMPRMMPIVSPRGSARLPAAH